MRQDIRTFRYELLNVLKMNDFKTPNLKNEQGAIGKKSRNLERQIQKGFQISKAETTATDIFAMTAMKLQKQFSTASKMSRNSRGSKRASMKTKLTGKQKFKGLALKAIHQEHGEDHGEESGISHGNFDIFLSL